MASKGITSAQSDFVSDYAPTRSGEEGAHIRDLPSASQRSPKWNVNSRAYLCAAIGFLGIFLFGYDAGLGGGVLVLPSFASDFGIEGTAEHVADLQGNVVSIFQGGAFFGALGSSPIMDKMGRKWSLMVGCVVFMIGGIVQTVCFGNLNQFYIGRLVAGLGVGLMSSVCPTYSSEIAPKEIRGRVTGQFQVIVVTGVAISFWINYAVSLYPASAGSLQWRVPIGFQLVPVGLMMILLPIMKESPRWLATKDREDLALKNLAWLRKADEHDEYVLAEFAEITAAIAEERAATKGASWRECFSKGNPIRFGIAFVIFTLQQWSGQNSISYYAPTIFKAIGITGSSTSLLASGIYGIVKIISTGIFIAFGIERFGRKKPLAIGVAMMSGFLFIIGAVFNTHPPVVGSGTVSSASIAMAVMIYLFVIPYCFSVGPLPWVICAEIFNNRTRSYGLALTASTQWFWNFVVSKCTPLMVIGMPKGGIFFFFAVINIVSFGLTLLLPETQGKSLEDMDLLFGSVTQEERDAGVARRAAELHATEKMADEHEHVEDRK
ncbi:sugar transporter [Dioszegia hungarica]|uniref:Sugar transporter n=1 Tax=Dioszegia hungarica TaxID=4972 RepID=A0AA38HB59_9TREE|nr:sugar transporter [Dioszegia hungarica]KAI9635769.1 sugar transporter [Dioszegia hungarica]